jgi:flagellar protein FliO/FliZ
VANLLRQFYLFIILICIGFLAPPAAIVAQADSHENTTNANDGMSVKEALETGGNNSSDRNEADNPSLILSENERPPESELSWFDFVKMIFALFFVIFLIYVILRFVNQRNRMFGQAKALRNLGGVPLGANRSIQLIKVGERILVVGVGDDVRLLQEIRDENEIQALASFNEDSSIPNAKMELGKWFRLRKNKSVPDEDDQSTFNSLLKAQLNSLTEGRKKILGKYTSDKEDKNE